MSDFISRAALLKALTEVRDAYVHEHFSYDPDTGAYEASSAKEEYLCYLDENIEFVQGFASATVLGQRTLPQGDSGTKSGSEG